MLIKRSLVRLIHATEAADDASLQVSDINLKGITRQINSEHNIKKFTLT